MSHQAYHFVVHGSVQGVGFRSFVEYTARTLKLGGWVKNRSDGCVEGAVLGAPTSIVLFRKALEQGPPAARVEALDWSAIPLPTGFERFRVIY